MNSRPATLRDLSVTYYISDWHHSFQEPYLLSDIFATLRKVLSDSPVRLHWHLGFESDDVDDGLLVQHVADFARFVQLELPTVHAEGRLIVEQYSVRSYASEWV
ncbi:hypothetical protein DFH09DRAFT_1336356 [Mycena vulgaris]|nr:hypothetical protein DFH09DRAFT_1336356 [Mycena vulgaris]